MAGVWWPAALRLSVAETSKGVRVLSVSMEQETRYVPTHLLEEDEEDVDPDHRDPMLAAALGYR